jgi:hypothetical protein
VAVLLALRPAVGVIEQIRFRLQHAAHAAADSDVLAQGKERYGELCISREDVEARKWVAAANWDCFGAPAALFCYIDRDLGRPQWAEEACICRP